MKTEVLRAYRFTLDPTTEQEQTLLRWCGNSRLAFNYALAAKKASHEAWRTQVAELVEQGTPEVDARKKVKVPIPGKPTVQKAFLAERGDTRTETEGVCPWWHEVNTHVFQSAWIDADRAWKNWLDSFKGARAGRRVGYPRFKKRGRSRDSFRLHHDVKRPSIRLATHRRLRLPSFGEVRLHDSGKQLARTIGRGEAVIQSVTVSRGGHRWYASVLCKVTMDLPTRASKAQQKAGAVGVDLGVRYLAALSKPLDRGDEASAFVANPRHLKASSQRLTKAQRALARTQKGSVRREKAKRRVGRLHQQVAEQRKAALHQVTKKLTSRFATVAVEDLNVAGMTRSAKGTVENPGRKVRQKSGLNRSILDASLGEFRRQLTYKTSWYGSQLAVLDRWWPSSKTCSECGWRNPSLTLAERVFTCMQCGLIEDRDMNAARNIERHAVPTPNSQVASDKGETQNARGADVSPVSLRTGRQSALKREDTGHPGLVPPQRSDPLAFPNPRQGQAKLF
ncbi:RNA-guided endonuclease InsQ/TnpB family protein [Streptomyces sp. NPDC056192]|uniref:RNA-guided endonuclease InsQ/TnpB family protein n=1 Tax=Streptomyces sp. NPDC056192 TaxID=3345743 RepID=UPI0035DE4062